MTPLSEFELRFVILKSCTCFLPVRLWCSSGCLGSGCDSLYPGVWLPPISQS